MLRFLLAVFTILITFGTPTAVQAQQLYIKKLLPQRRNESLKPTAQLVDNQGALWIAAGTDLIKHDGHQAIRYSLPESTASTGNISALGMGPKSQLWAGTKTGHIFSFTDGVFTEFDPEEGRPELDIRDIVTNSLGHVWFATYGEGIYIWTGSRLYSLDIDDGLAESAVYDLELLSDGRIAAATDGGVSICGFDGETKTCENFTSADGLADDIVLSLAADGNDLYIGMYEGGIAHLDLATKQLQALPGAEFPDWGEVTSMLIQDELLWAATTRKGVLFADRTLPEPVYVIPEQERELRSTHALTPATKGSFFATTTGGVYVTAGATMLTKTELTPAINNIINITKHPKEGIWFTDGRQVYFTRLGGMNDVTIVADAESLLNSSITTLSTGNDGSLWVGTYENGLFRHRKGQPLMYYNAESGLPNTDIFAIAHQGTRMWVATAGGVASTTPGAEQMSWSVLNTDTGLPTNYIYAVYPDSKGNIWIGTSGNGIVLVEKGKLKQPKHLAKVASNDIFTITEDGAGRLWFGSLESGAHFVENGELHSLSDSLGTPSSVTAIVPDSLGNILLFHEEGLDLIDYENLGQTRIGRSYGWGEQQINLNAAARSHSGNIWAGSQEGLLAFRPVKQVYGEEQPVTLQGVDVLSQPIGLEQEQDFGHRQNTFTFYLQAPHFLDQQQVMYQYKLEGLESEWRTTNQPEIEYPALPPGNFTLNVRASSNNRFENQTPLTWSFEVTPPIWQRWWFIALVLAGLVFGVATYVKLKEKNLREAKVALEQEVKKRTSQIMEQKEEIEQQRDQISAKNDGLIAANKSIEEQNIKITSSINYALRIQKAMLPTQDYLHNILPEHFMLFMPRDIVSGDFYWAYQKGSKTYLAAVDCTGHGVPGAFMSLVGNEQLNQQIKVLEMKEPGYILETLNDGVVSALKQNDNDNRDGMDVALVVIDQERRVLEYSGAHRPLWCYKRGRLTEFKGTRASIGGRSMRATNTFEQHTVRLEEGVTYYLFSDGYIDQFGGPEGRKYMTGRLKKYLATIHELPMEEQKKMLSEEIVSWMAEGNTRQIDDILVIGFRA
jgi:ligand-binding sensor domain-containing protein/serine phosphatase RsbU (regulator of sigma subunit)